MVSWYDAVEFCNKLSELEGLTPVYMITGRTPAAGYPITSATVTADWSNNGYRLPTEAEWEYAAKGGPLADIDPDPDDIEYYAYAGSNTASQVAVTGTGTSNPQTVGSLAPNQLELYNMSGNAYEWCWDWFATYTSGTQNNPTGPLTGTQRVARGGSFRNAATVATVVYRLQSDPDTTQGLGFRLVRNAD
jgi:formylglycine-generating enzyme required for sulfatase activity